MAEYAVLVGQFVIDPDVFAVVVVRVGSGREKVVLIAGAHTFLIRHRIHGEQLLSYGIEPRRADDVEFAVVRHLTAIKTCAARGKRAVGTSVLSAGRHLLGRARIINNERRAIGVECLREIAGFFQGRGHGGREAGTGRAVVKLLVGAEEESPVVSVVPGEDYRAAHLASKLVS